MIDDLISKRAVLELAHDLKIPMNDHNGEEYTYSHRCIDPHAILELPSAQKKGKWIEINLGYGGINYGCSCCKEVFILMDGTPFDNLYFFCPHCGADMRGEK